MGVDDRAEKFPGASATIHAHHAKDLEESQAAQGGCGEDLTSASQRDNDQTGNDRNDI